MKNNKKKDYTNIKDIEVLSYMKEMKLDAKKYVEDFMTRPFWCRWFFYREFKMGLENKLLKFEIWYNKHRKEKESKRIKSLIEDFREANKMMSKNEEEFQKKNNIVEK